VTHRFGKYSVQVVRRFTFLGGTAFDCWIYYTETWPHEELIAGPEQFRTEADALGWAKPHVEEHRRRLSALREAAS
jgi:hypothetical protein